MVKAMGFKKKKPVRISLYVPSRLAKKLNKEAEASECSLNEYCVRALENHEKGLVLNFHPEMQAMLLEEAASRQLDLRSYCYYQLAYHGEFLYV
jgi:hypothetical protein